MDQIDFYKTKLNFETDSWDLSEALRNGDNVTKVSSKWEDF